jgi:hypothetical protein
MCVIMEHGKRSQFRAHKKCACFRPFVAVFDGHSKGSSRFFNHSLFRVAGPSWSNVFPSS